MKTAYPQSSDAARLAELREREKQIVHNPSAESYLELADQYHALGFGKESDRLLQLAEAFENATQGPTIGLLSGAANPIMLTEIIQILSRTKSSGDFVVDSQAETFHLYFDHGQIINASSQSQPQGVPSFRMAVQVVSGSYRFVQMPTAKMPRLIHGGTELLLLDAMHDNDIASTDQ